MKRPVLGGPGATVVPFACAACPSPRLDESKLSSAELKIGCVELLLFPKGPVPTAAAAGVGVKLNSGRVDGIWGGSAVTAAGDGAGSPSGVGDLEGDTAAIPISDCLHL